MKVSMSWRRSLSSSESQVGSAFAMNQVELPRPTERVNILRISPSGEAQSPSSMLSSPAPPPKDEREPPVASASMNLIKSTLSHVNLKCFSSLPRMPSTTPKDANPQIQHDSCTPSPSGASVKSKIRRPKIKNCWPFALKSDEIVSKKSGAEDHTSDRDGLWS